MRQLVASTTEASAIHPRLAAYIESMTGHCPFLGPSLSRSLTTWCGYEASAEDAPQLIALLVDTAEQVRQLRRTHGQLSCANVAIYGPTDIPSAQAVLDWPHWITRKLYAPVQLMVGKFYIGEQEDDKRGVAIAAPPVSFFSIRHSTPAKDARFLANLPGVAAQLAGANEDNRDVLMPWLAVPCTPETVMNRFAELMALFPAERKVRHDPR
jgi:hypothetical protein